MKKVIVLSALLLVTGMSVYAQEDFSKSIKTTTTIVENADKYKVETNRFWSNWFVTAGGGALIFFGDHNMQMKFGDRLSPALDIGFGKWFTPGIGVRFMYSGLTIKGATQNGSHSTGKVYDASQWLDEQKFDFMNIHGDVLFNASNLLCGYNEKRFWSVTPYVGLGWILTWETPRARNFNASIGLINSFRLSSAFDLNLDVRGTATKDEFDGERGGRKEEGLLSVTVGVTYKFPRRTWGRSTVKTITFSDEELRLMREQLKAMNGENNRLKNELVETSNKVTERVVETNILSAPYLVTFQISRYALSNEARVNIGFQAKIMKENKNAVYTIIGYADKGTGTKEFNQFLSKSRAEAVYNCLVNEFGVPASQLKITYEGGVDNMFYDDPRVSRAVITVIK
ncbi:OmpA family protein [Bacteroides thetaiotaomicron]|uniref:OmpA family protein n=1 Tax=Bacteroides thetaiotaomicron TaxID=818 RepID=UPI00221E62A1|nr:OmpA family protein [Bacteroides thetaiotaomicron]UYU76080.1 OmpA family protein [Bacteroides thetaiotaomicron]